MLIDLHCHLDLYPDYKSIFEKVENNKIYTLTMTTTPRAWKQNFELSKARKYIMPALGLHPQLIDKYFEELSLWKKYLCETRYVGEVGLDASPYFYKSFDKQKYVFKHILEECSSVGGKIISIHSVRCASTVLDMVEQYFSMEKGTIILHWFSGNKKEMQRALALGCYFSINSEMTKSNSGRNLIFNLPLTRIFTETDGPFVKINRRVSDPTDILNVVHKISQIKSVANEIIVSKIQENFFNILNKNI